MNGISRSRDPAECDHDRGRSRGLAAACRRRGCWRARSALRAASRRGWPPSAAPADVARLQADVDRLKQEVRDQRQLILQLMQAEQQRYDIVLKYLQAGGGARRLRRSRRPRRRRPCCRRAGARERGRRRAPAARRAAGASRRRSPGTCARNGQRDRRGVRLRRRRALEPGPRAHRRDQAAGQAVRAARGGGAARDPRSSSPTRTRSSTTCSRPRPATRSISARSRGARRRPPVTLLKPGPVEIFCNIHSKMRADILVVPNAHWTRVSSDGSFSLVGRPRRDAQDRALEPDAEADLAAGRGDVEGGDGDVRVRGHGGPSRT